jgi:hypothetical protein
MKDVSSNINSTLFYWKTEMSGFDSVQDDKRVLFFTASRPALGLI